MGLSWLKGPLLEVFILSSLALLLFAVWSYNCGPESLVGIYFGTPEAAATFLQTSGHSLIRASLYCLATALGSLVVSTIIAIALLVVGLLFEGWLVVIERFAAAFQTLPILVIVTAFLLMERELFRVLDVEALPDIYCILPVSLSLAFAPLINAIGAINRMPVDLRALLRLWDAPAFWRIRRVYLPYVMSDILTGVRASATWAVGAVLIAEGMVNGVSGDVDTLGNALIRPFTGGKPGQTPAVILIATVLGFLVYRIYTIVQWNAERMIYGKTTTDRQRYPLQQAKSKR